MHNCITEHQWTRNFLATFRFNIFKQLQLLFSIGRQQSSDQNCRHSKLKKQLKSSYLLISKTFTNRFINISLPQKVINLFKHATYQQWLFAIKPFQTQETFWLTWSTSDCFTAMAFARIRQKKLGNIMATKSHQKVRVQTKKSGATSTPKKVGRLQH